MASSVPKSVPDVVPLEPAGGGRRKLQTKEASRPSARRKRPVLRLGERRVRDSGLQEADLIEQARTAVLKSPKRALRLCRKHVRQFPNGELLQEREVIAARALMTLGRFSAARRRATKFLGRFPDSIHAEAMRKLVEQSRP